MRSRRTEMSSEMGQAVLNLAQRGPAKACRVGHGLPGLVAIEANLAQAEAQFAQDG